jgi:hypothetical protein
MWSFEKGGVVRVVFCVWVLASAAATAAIAQDQAITEDMRSLSFTQNGQTHRIARTAPAAATVEQMREALDPACPPSCIQPMQIAPGVATVGELEVLDFMTGPVTEGTGLLVDARLAPWFTRGTLPGAISMPYPALAPDNSFLPDILQALGATDAADGWNFATALDLLVFGNGPAADMAPRAISGLIEAGFPPSKLRWYRGGVTGWSALGLTITEPEG